MRRPSSLRGCLPCASTFALRHCSTAGPTPGGPVICSSRAVEASYDAWAKSKGQCNVAGLLRGAKQAYMSLGAVIDASVKTPKQELDNIVSAILRSGRSLSGSMATTSGDADSVLPSVDKSPVGGVSQQPDGQSISLATLPIGNQLKYHIALVLKAGNGGQMNPYILAHPNDYIMDAWIQSFQQYDATTGVVASVMSVEATRDELQSDGTVATKTETVTVKTVDVPPSSQEAAHAASTSNATTTSHSGAGVAAAAPEEGGSGAGADKAASATANDTSEPRPNPSDALSDKRVSISTTTPATTIPRNAQAYVLVGLLVAAPPRRFHAAYDWFYSRVQGHESENERVSLATIFSSSTAIGFMRVFDHLVKLFTGSPAGFQSTKTLLSLLRLPDELATSVMGKRKFVGLYLSKEGEWTLAELSNSSEKFDFKPRGMAPPAE